MFSQFTRRAYASLIKIRLEMYTKDDKAYNTDELLSIVAALTADQQKQIEKLEEMIMKLKESTK